MTTTSGPLGGVTAEGIRERVWSELQSACADRDHAWRTPVLATIGLDGTPQARTVVLREARTLERQLLFYTDRRSPKVAQLLRNPVATLIFWSRALNWQLRLPVRLQVEVDGDAVQAAWEQVRASGSAIDYLTPHAPGAVLLHTDASATDVHQLALLTAHVESMDWLELVPGGHRRAKITDSALHWLVP